MIESQNEVVDQLKDGLQTMHQKLDQLKSKRDSLVARQKSAHAQAQVQESMASINVLDPTSEISPLRGADPARRGSRSWPYRAPELLDRRPVRRARGRFEEHRDRSPPRSPQGRQQGEAGHRIRRHHDLLGTPGDLGPKSLHSGTAASIGRGSARGSPPLVKSSIQTFSQIFYSHLLMKDSPNHSVRSSSHPTLRLQPTPPPPN